SHAQGDPGRRRVAQEVATAQTFRAISLWHLTMPPHLRNLVPEVVALQAEVIGRLVHVVAEGALQAREMGVMRVGLVGPLHLGQVLHGPMARLACSRLGLAWRAIGHVGMAVSTVNSAELVDVAEGDGSGQVEIRVRIGMAGGAVVPRHAGGWRVVRGKDRLDRKSTRLNSSHVKISYAVF